MTEKLLLNEFFPFRLSIASNAVSGLIASAYEQRFGLRIPEWRLIAVLFEDGASTQQALVKRTGMDKVTISRAAQALAKRRYISRTAHEHDGRSHHLILTAEGEKLFAEIAPAAKAYETDILKSLSTDEVAQLKSLLVRVEEAALALQKAL